MALERLESVADVVWRDAAADHLARYEFAKAFVKGKVVLDAGSGIGYGSMLLTTGQPKTVLGLDIDKKSVSNAASLFSASNLSYVVGDCETLDAAVGAYDVICNFENIEHLKHPEAFLKSAAAKLVPGGVLLCSTPDRVITLPFVSGKPANPYHINEWYRDEFRDLLRRYFRSVEMHVQVKTFAQEERELMVEVFRRHEAVMVQPLVRMILKVGRGLRLFGADAYSIQLPPGARPGIADPSDYPIIHEAIARLYGKPYCHYAVCREPII